MIRYWQGGLVGVMTFILTACGATTPSPTVSASVPVNVRLVIGNENPVIVGSDTIHLPVDGTLVAHPSNGAAQAAARHGKLELTTPSRRTEGTPQIKPKPSLTLRFPKAGGYYAYLVVNPRNANTHKVWGYRRITVLVGPHAKAPTLPAWLGVFVETDSPAVVQQYHLMDGSGAVVGYVAPHSPASQAGLKAGEVIIAVGHHPILTAPQLAHIIDTDHPGQKVTLAVVLPHAPANAAGTILKTARLNPEPLTLVTVPASATLVPPSSQSHSVPTPQPTLTFGTGFDEAAFSLTGIASTFLPGSTVYWLLDNFAPFGTTRLVLQLYQQHGVTEQLINTQTVTLDPQFTEEEDALNKPLAPGTYQLLGITHNTVLASGTLTIR